MRNLCNVELQRRQRAAVPLDLPAQRPHLAEGEPARRVPGVPGLAQVVAEGAAAVGAVRDEPGHVPGERDQRLVGRQPREGRVGPGVEHLRELLQVGEDQLVLAGDVAVEDVLAGAGRLDDLAHAHVVDAALVEEPASSPQDAVAGGRVSGTGHHCIVPDRPFRKVLHAGNEPSVAEAGTE